MNHPSKSALFLTSQTISVPFHKRMMIVCQALLAACFLLSTTHAAWEKDRPAKPPVIPPNPDGLPLVLLIGDSISGAYLPTVTKELAGKAVVAKSTDNGESTAVGVIKIDGWLGDTKWDVIHFNWGLWDIYGWQYAADDRSPKMYEQRLEQLVERMKKTGAKLIWATTTPTPPKPEKAMLKRWQKEVVIAKELEAEYREAALRVMKKHGVQVNDLHATILPHVKELQPEGDVHYKAGGNVILGKKVAESIRSCLN
jgi:acyl-CoA thioesterase-1